MNSDFNRLLASSIDERRDLFLATAARLGTTMQNIEKDFWVCWTLDALFNGLEPGGPRLLFKGGTSLSKGYGLIERFSEDIDITIFREDIDVPALVADLEALSRKRRDRRLEDIRKAGQAFIGGTLKAQLEELAAALPVTGGHLRVVLDDDDADGQTLLLQYPAVSDHDPYIHPAVKIEAGAKSALDPHTPLVVRPYVADDLTGFDLSVPNVTTVDPVRTFWDKVLILHSLRRSFEDRGVLRGGGQRVSRHYYDVDRMLRTARRNRWRWPKTVAGMSECYLNAIIPAIVELGRSGAFMRCHLLRVFEESTVQQIDGDPGRPKRVAAERGNDPGLARAPNDHAPRVLPAHSFVHELLAPAAAQGAEEGAGFVGSNAGGGDIGVDIGFEQMVGRHLVLLAAFFVQAHPPAFSLRVVVFDGHVQRCRDAREAIYGVQ
jgi:Nucleotidyl transferase AbiEii toxin, Type IV TA system